MSKSTIDKEILWIKEVLKEHEVEILKLKKMLKTRSKPSPKNKTKKNDNLNAFLRHQTNLNLGRAHKSATNSPKFKFS